MRPDLHGARGERQYGGERANIESRLRPGPATCPISAQLQHLRVIMELARQFVYSPTGLVNAHHMWDWLVLTIYGVG